MSNTNYLYSDKIREEELKNRIAIDFFADYDYSNIIENIDFCVALKKNTLQNQFDTYSLLWAEAKRGYNSDLYASFVQLILTIGKNKIYERFLPPPFLGAFDAEKIAFIAYNQIIDVFAINNDFNWNVAPSDHTTKEFQELLTLVKEIFDNNLLVFHFCDQEKLQDFIHNNLVFGKKDFSKLQITKNNFISVYYHWLEQVKPTIKISWDKAKQVGILDADFYLADLLSDDNVTLKDRLYVLLKKDHYEFDRKIDDMELINTKTAIFTDRQKAHLQFWQYYERPPKEEFWDFIIDRRDLLVPQDVRERKGSFYTPRQWVELSQQYLADYFGKNWQEEYYIWDCAAGTGNLLVGLINKYHIWASTLDQADVDIMKDRVANGANLLESHIFQFDFLNDDFSKLPEDLQDVINDEQKRKKLIIYINPPYAGATSSKSIVYKESKHKCGVANTTQTYLKYKQYAGKGINELSVQFLLRSYFEIQNAYICNFSKITLIQGSNFKLFRNNFQAKLEKLFLVPSYTFDNVTGKFPIGFFIWNTTKKVIFKKIIATVYNQDSSILCKKNMICPNMIIMKWLQRYYDHTGQRIAYLVRGASDFQNNRTVFITDSPSQSVIDNCICHSITMNNLSEMCIYFTVRHIIQHIWLNDRDQFLFPNKLWERDPIFQTDCLTFALFNNNVKSNNGQNDWIPFTEQEVHAQSNFKSHFMVDYITGKLAQQNNVSQQGLKIQQTSLPQNPLQFSQEAQDVFTSAKALYQYYHAQDKINVNASLYEIREYFQQRNAKGKLNVVSKDLTYNDLNNQLKATLKILAAKIAPKVYDYGFLKR